MPMPGRPRHHTGVLGVAGVEAQAAEAASWAVTSRFQMAQEGVEVVQKTYQAET